MEILSEKLAQLLKLPSEDSLLTQEQILVQSPGMSTWLRLEIARHNGIAAAQEFPLPSSFIWQLCYLLLDDVPPENPFTKAAMTWKLMTLLPEMISAENFAPLRHYLGEIDTQATSSNAAEQALKLYQLSNRIADIFDQYLVYRPDWILAWEQDDTPIELPPEQGWQPELWRALVAYNADQLKQSHYHRANLHQALIDKLKDPQQSLSALPTRLFVFGISSMAPQTLDVLHALANRIDVFMLSLSPCQHYWGDIVDPKARAKMALNYSDKKQLPELWEDKLEVGNPLLANNGKMGREMLDMVLELEADNLALYDLFTEPEYSSMLKGIQGDILEMETLGVTLGPDIDHYLNIAKRRVLSPKDNSITLRSCHSPLREVETLHDHLLHMFKRFPALHPRDIVVMMPDIAGYAPYIDAVFSAKTGNHFIPYAIADRGAAQESPLISSFLSLLTLDKSRFGFTEILSILEVPAVMNRFNISDEELEQLKYWLKNAGVRWGRDKQSTEKQGLPAFDKHSWAFGIRRMILGYALGDEASLYHGDLPLSGIEGQSAQSLGKLLNFIEALDQTRQQMQTQQNAATRVTELSNLLNTFYLANLTDDKVLSDINQIREAIEKFHSETSQSDFTQALELKVVAQWFNSVLSESKVGQRYLAGSVNFCTLMPMRSIPFKIVCLLGMNDGVYPRLQHPVGFDLMAHFGPRRGDRSRRLDDRYLFLEALLSAREQLYISYVGHSERDNSERIPSMLVSELLEYCQLCYRPDDSQFDITPETKEQIVSLGNKSDNLLLEQLLITQPLQPFDARLYTEVQEDKTQLPRSFARQWCPISQAQSNAGNQPFISEPLSDTEQTSQGSIIVDELELSALIRFYRSPAQYFCQRSLKVDLSLDIDTQEDDEPFELNPLQRYQLQLLMMQDALENAQGEVSHTLLDELKADGQLPMAPFDNLLIEQYCRDIAPAIDRTQFMRGRVNHQPEDNDAIATDSMQNIAEPEVIDIDLTLTHQEHKLRLTGRIEDLYPKGLVNVRPGTSKPKDFLRLYIRHLCLNASGIHKSSYLLDMGHFHTFEPLDQKQALSLLQTLVELFFTGNNQPLPFMAKTSMAYIEIDQNHPDWPLKEKLDELETVWLDDNGYGDGADYYNARLFRFPEDFMTLDKLGFSVLATSILLPMLSLYSTDKLANLFAFVEKGQANEH